MSTELEEKIRTEVGRVITNASNFPQPMRVHMWGRDLSEPIDKITNAIASLVEDAKAELAERNRRLANQIVGHQSKVNDSLTAIIRTAKADAWDESRAASDREWSEITAGVSAHDMGTAEETPNPYRSNDE